MIPDGFFDCLSSSNLCLDTDLQEEERRRLLREKAYGEALRQNAAKTAALIANADAPDVARANAHAIEMLHHHTAF